MKSVTENEIAHHIVDVAFKIHTRLGPGIFESIYESILESELRKRGLSVERQKGIPVGFHAKRVSRKRRKEPQRRA
ncbi:MAG TPA: GxxExxY protein [Blastocatellia bacterium]|nr:GxxExxY protein [Blastocatellia bacterium]